MAGPTRLELATSGVTGLDFVPLFSTSYNNYQQLINDSGQQWATCDASYTQSKPEQKPERLTHPLPRSETFPGIGSALSWLGNTQVPQSRQYRNQWRGSGSSLAEPDCLGQGL